MSEEFVEEIFEEVPEEVDDLHAHFHDLMELFDELTFREKWQRVFAGLKEPIDSGEHKWARLQMIRLSAPAAAVIVPMLALLILMLIPGQAQMDRTVEVEIVDPEEIEELDDIEEIQEEPPEPPDITEMEFNAEVVTQDLPAPPTDFSPQPVEFDAVAIVKSPIIMRGIYGSRNPGQRGSLLGRHGAPPGTELAVLRALRWLKKYQSSEGCWKGDAGGGKSGQAGAWAAYTGLGLLTFLAHGDTPASEEFGETVEKAIRWLVDNQNKAGTFDHKDGHNYSHPIAAYAVCEAYGMTKVPILKGVAEKAIAVICNGCNPNGGWNYNCDGSGRNDTSYSAWCAQALKAAKMSGIHNPGLKKGLACGIKGMRANAKEYGGFGYTSPGAGRLTGAGVLCMQLLGQGRDSTTQAGLGWMRQNVTCRWEKQGKRPYYYWYYETQAFFHAGGNDWKQWNRQFATELCKNQTVVKGAGVDGKDIGYWVDIGDSEKYGYPYNTTLCALMLQVYYRFLPTYQEIKIDEAPELVNQEEDIEIDIDI